MENGWGCGPKLHDGALSCEHRRQLPIAAQRPPEAATLYRGTLWPNDSPTSHSAHLSHPPGLSWTYVQIQAVGPEGLRLATPSSSGGQPHGEAQSCPAASTHYSAELAEQHNRYQSGGGAQSVAIQRAESAASNTGNWTPRSHHQLWIQRKVQLRPVSLLRHPPAWRWSRGSPRQPAGRARQESHRAFAWRMCVDGEGLLAGCATLASMVLHHVRQAVVLFGKEPFLRPLFRSFSHLGSHDVQEPAGPH